MVKWPGHIRKQFSAIKNQKQYREENHGNSDPHPDRFAIILEDRSDPSDQMTNGYDYEGGSDNANKRK